VEASGSADLLVVGSRGLHGLRALGSVGERVANQASCSVLVVRDAGLLMVGDNRLTFVDEA
jgi:nucleotide-binding universal stress UspA family protein